MNILLRTHFKYFIRVFNPSKKCIWRMKVFTHINCQVVRELEENVVSILIVLKDLLEFIVEFALHKFPREIEWWMPKRFFSFKHTLRRTTFKRNYALSYSKSNLWKIIFFKSIRHTNKITLVHIKIILKEINLLVVDF